MSSSTIPREEIELPRVPSPYQLAAVPVPLLTSQDERWIGRVVGPEGEGVLIYEDQRAIAFLVADEALVALHYLMQESASLLPHADPHLLEAHGHSVETVRSLWWIEEEKPDQ